MKKIGLGLIGGGWISEFHLKAMQDLGNIAEVVAVADVDKNKAEKLSKKYRIKKSFSDYKKLLDLKEVRGVIVCVPTFAHREVSIAAAERGKHILCEKPFAPTVRDCDRMIKAANKNKVLLMPGHNRIFFPPHLRVKEIIAKGEIGKPIIYQGNFIMAGPGGSLDFLRQDWRSDREKGGGPIMESAVHQIYTAIDFMGDIKSVTAQLVFYKEVEIEKGGTITLKFTNGSIGVLTIYWGVDYWDDDEKIIGTKGVIEVRGVEWQALCQPPLGIYDYKTESWNLPSVDWNWGKSFVNLIFHFVECINGKNEPIVTAGDGRNTICVVEAIYQSAKEKREVKIIS